MCAYLFGRSFKPAHKTKEQKDGLWFKCLCVSDSRTCFITVSQKSLARRRRKRWSCFFIKYSLRAQNKNSKSDATEELAVSLTDEQYKRIIHSCIIRDYEDLPLLPLLHYLPD